MAPGPDMLLITQIVLVRRRLRPAVAASLGMITAGAVQVLVGMAGLAAALAVNPALFRVFRWIGAAVLVIWAVRAVRAVVTTSAPAGPPPDLPDRRAFGLGLLCTGSNPKVCIFLMAFLPQFVPASVDPVTGVARLAGVYLALGLLWLLVWMSLVDRFGRLMHAPTTARVAHGVLAVVFSVFAVRLILE